MRRLRCKGEEDEGRREDGSRVYPRSDVVINQVKGFEEGVSPMNTSSTSILKGGALVRIT